MALQRTTHWATRELDSFLRDHRHTPFAWGLNDCCLFAANAIQAFTGTDIAADFRGKYTDEASAFALIKSVTGSSTVADAVAWCAEKHGLLEWPTPRYAQRGDLLVMENGGAQIAGVLHLSGRHGISMAQDGPVRLPLSAIVRAWHV
jgi:hypothetical protein